MRCLSLVPWLVFGCAPGRQLEDRGCPCISGYTCDLDRNLCVRVLDERIPFSIASLGTERRLVQGKAITIHVRIAADPDFPAPFVTDVEETPSTLRVIPRRFTERAFDITVSAAESAPLGTTSFSLLARSPAGRAARAQIELQVVGRPGALDATFTGDGSANDMPFDEVYDTLPLENLTWLAAGKRGSSACIARYLENGELDPSFGQAGLACSSCASAAHTVLASPEGDLMGVGPSPSGIGMFRLESDGRPRLSWANGGCLFEAIPSVGIVRAQALPGGGAIVAAESHPEGITIVRFEENGALASGFGHKGRLLLPAPLPKLDTLRVDEGFTVVGSEGGTSPRGFAWFFTEDGLPRASAGATGKYPFATPGFAAGYARTGDGWLACRGDGRAFWLEGMRGDQAWAFEPIPLPRLSIATGGQLVRHDEHWLVAPTFLLGKEPASLICLLDASFQAVASFAAEGCLGLPGEVRALRLTTDKKALLVVQGLGPIVLRIWL